MSNKRYLQLGHQLRDEISAYLQRGVLRDPRIGFVSISGVRVSTDLRHAKVFVSVFGSPEEAQASVNALQGAKNFLRRQLGQDLHIRHVPELIFVQDDSIAEGARINQLIHNAMASQVPQSSEPSTDDSSTQHTPSEDVQPTGDPR